VRRVVLLLSLVALVANAKYIKVASFVNINDAVNKFAKLSKDCNSDTYLYKNGKRYEIRVDNISKLSKIQKKFKSAKVVDAIAREKNFIEVASLYKSKSIPDMFYSLRKVDGAYVKSSGKFYEFRVDIKSKSGLEKSYPIVKSKYKDAWVKYPFASSKQASKYVATPKPQPKKVNQIAKPKYIEVAKPVIRRDISKIDRNTPKVIKVAEPVLPKKNIQVNEPVIPNGVITIAKETDEYLGTRVEIKRGKQVLMSGRVLNGYTDKDIYCEK
jgi:hypothetical protein